MSEYNVGSLSEFAMASISGAMVAGQQLAIVRDADGTVYALGSMCSHGNVSLLDGEIEGGTLECPKHYSQFDLATGYPRCLPATEPIPTYPVRVTDDHVYVTIDASKEQ